MYGVLPYYLSKVFTDLPILLLSQILFAVVLYWGIGTVTSFWAFLRFNFTVILLAFAATSFGHFLSVLFTQPETAVQLSPILMMPFIIFGGFITNAASQPEWISWLQWLSPIRYGLESLTYNEFTLRDDVSQLAMNPITFLHFTLGYGVSMILLLVISIALRILCVIILKLRVTRF